MAAPSADEMRGLVKKGKAMPAPGQSRPGRFYIRNATDLDNAIRAVGQVKPPTSEARAKVRRFVMQRAKALGLSSKIPDTWQPDGNLKPGASS